MINILDSCRACLKIKKKALNALKNRAQNWITNITYAKYHEVVGQNSTIIIKKCGPLVTSICGIQ